MSHPLSDSSRSPSPPICTYLPISLLGRCCSFLNQQELCANHIVSHIFHAATTHNRTHATTWKENALKSVDDGTPLESTLDLIQLNEISSSSRSFGRGTPPWWLDVDGKKMTDVKEIEAVILDKATKLDGLTIRHLNRSKWWDLDHKHVLATDSIVRLPVTPITCLRSLSIGDVDHTLMNSLVPTISSVHSLEILSFGISVPVAHDTRYYSLPNNFAALSRLKNLHQIALCDPCYHRLVNNQPELPNQRMVFLTNASLGVLQMLVSLAPQITRIELSCFLNFPTSPRMDPLPSSTTPLPQVTTLVVKSSDFQQFPARQRLNDLFPNLTHLLDLAPYPPDSNPSTPWSFFEWLAASSLNITEMTLANLCVGRNSLYGSHLSYPLTSLPSPLKVHRLTIHHLLISADALTPNLTLIFGHVKEFHFHKFDTISVGYFMGLVEFMPQLEICTYRWRHQDEHAHVIDHLKHLFAARFLKLKQLRIVADADASFRSAYDARWLLRCIPHLQTVKWNDEPWLPMERLEEYYSWEAIQMRLKQRLNFKQLDQIQPLLQHINTSPLPNAINLNLLSLTLIFQFLTPHDLFSAHRVCRSYRVAAVSPLVLRPNIRVRIDHDKGVIVSGTQVSFTSIKPMLSAVRSMLFQNIRILTLPRPLYPAILALPRQPDFYAYHLDRFELIPRFHSLHSLSLDWSGSDASLYIDPDHSLIDRVFQSAAVKHLKTLKLIMPPVLLKLMLTQCVSHLSELKVVDIRVTPFDGLSAVHFLPFGQLSQLSSLKQVYVDQWYYNYNTTMNDLTQLHELSRLSPSIESIHWCPTIYDERIQQFLTMHDPPITISPLHTVQVELIRLADLPSLVLIDRAFPSLTSLRLSDGGRAGPAVVPPPITLPQRFCHQLRSLEIHLLGTHLVYRLIGMLSQTVNGVPVCVWSRLERFVLCGGQGSIITLATNQLTTILRSMNHLKSLTLESVEFSMDLDPQPWIGRLHFFQLSDHRQLVRLLPFAHQLIQLRLGLLSDARVIFDLIPDFLTAPHLVEVIFRDRTLTRGELIRQRQQYERRLEQRYQANGGRRATTLNISSNKQTTTPIEPITPAAASVTCQTHPTDDGTVTSGTDSSPPIDAPTLTPVAEASLDPLAAILMELAESFHTHQLESK